jgi:hypothetical protein
MTPDATYYVERLLFQRKRGCKPTDTLAEADAKVRKGLTIDEDDATQIKRRLSDASQAELDKANGKRMENVGHDPFGYGAEARKKRVEKAVAREKRIKPLGSVFAPIDLTGSATERYATLQKLDADSARKARGPSKQDVDNAVEEDENSEGSATNPVDLTKHTERYSFARVSRVKARGTTAKTKGPRAKGAR